MDSEYSAASPMGITQPCNGVPPTSRRDLTGADTLLPRGAAAVGEACGKIQIQPYAFRIVGDGTANDPVLRIRFIFC